MPIIPAMFFTITLLQAINYLPGTVLETVYFNTSTCPHPTSVNTPGTCFSAYNQHPASFCRREDPTCKFTEQRVVSALGFTHYGACTVYAWTWICAHTARKSCGRFWCDNRSVCIDNEFCNCPNNMIGDPAWHSCGCPFGMHVNGSDTCVDLPVCRTPSPTLAPLGRINWNDDVDDYFNQSNGNITWPPTQGSNLSTDNDNVLNATDSKTNCDNNDGGVHVGIVIAVVVSGIISAGLLGFWCGHFYCNVSSTVVPAMHTSNSMVNDIARRHHTNLMYESADLPPCRGQHTAAADRN